ncbi:hypothetical protein ACIBH1_05065 [Nonomuraea sp. NPDC050663]|uniref:hypothetical protein n=1 Tax=Nonomuraea sp. NPDC050663 TaxID=3364370 RepID=UPI003792045F
MSVGIVVAVAILGISCAFLGSESAAIDDRRNSLTVSPGGEPGRQSGGLGHRWGGPIAAPEGGPGRHWDGPVAAPVHRWVRVVPAPPGPAASTTRRSAGRPPTPTRAGERPRTRRGLPDPCATFRDMRRDYCYEVLDSLG